MGSRCRSTGSPAGSRAIGNCSSQALANLVDNAIKYARPVEGTAGEIILAAGQRGRPGAYQRRRIAVRASREADRARVVERFVRLPQSMAQPGSGLGLSLAAAVARLHGGELTLEDNAPGLKVVITLPRAA